MADGTRFEIDIDADSNSAAEAAVLVARLADQLDVAEKAASSASEAFNLANTVYKAAESAANSAAKALEKMNLKVDEQRAKVAKLAEGQDGVVNVDAYRRAEAVLARFTAEQSKLAAVSAQATAKMNLEGQAVDKLGAAERAAAANVDRLTKAQAAAKTKADALKKSSEEAAGNGNFGKAASELAGIGGPLGQLASKAFGAADAFGDLSEALGSAGPYAAIAVAIVAIATAALTLTAAAVAGVAAITQWAVGLADVARTQRLLLDGIAKSTQGGLLLADAMDTIQAQVPITSEELAALAKPLADAGLKGAELKDALREAAVKAATLKFGPDFAKQLNSLPSLTARLQQNFARIFSGLKIDALLEALAKMVGLFDKNSESANAIKVVFESLFQPLVDGITAFIPKMISAFIQFEILVMKAMIAIKPFGSQIQEVAIAFGILAGIVALMAVGFAVAVIAPFAIIAALAVGLILAVRAVAQEFMDFGAKLSGLSLSEIGVQMMTGLANGITGAAAQVVAAITGAVNGAISAAKKALGIASPSKVFAEIGGYTAEGMAGGVDDGSGDVQKSLEAMVAPPDAKPGAAPGGGASGGGSPVFHIEINGVEGAQDILPQLIAALEGWVAQSGRAVANA